MILTDFTETFATYVFLHLMRYFGSNLLILHRISPLPEHVHITVTEFYLRICTEATYFSIQFCVKLTVELQPLCVH